jgi:uncharacterized protein (DUF2236 family)
MASITGMADMGAEAVLIAGGGRAILLQLADARIGAAIADHSDFATDPMRRLRHTLAYVYAQVYGSPEQQRATREWVERAHVPVRSAAYSADDPALQLWVAATLYDSAILVHETIYGPLPAEAAERILQDYAILGTALRLDPELWPSSRAEFAIYWEAQLAALDVTDSARHQAALLLRPAAAPWWLRLAMPAARLVTAGLLPASVREEFRMPWSPARARRFDRFMGFTRAVYPRLPRRLRQLPMRSSLAAVDRVMAGGR